MRMADGDSRESSASFITRNSQTLNHAITTNTKRYLKMTQKRKETEMIPKSKYDDLLRNFETSRNQIMRKHKEKEDVMVSIYNSTTENMLKKLYRRENMICILSIGFILSVGVHAISIILGG